MNSVPRASVEPRDGRRRRADEHERNDGRPLRRLDELVGPASNSSTCADAAARKPTAATYPRSRSIRRASQASSTASTDQAATSAGPSSASAAPIAERPIPTASRSSETSREMRPRRVAAPSATWTSATPITQPVAASEWPDSSSISQPAPDVRIASPSRRLADEKRRLLGPVAQLVADRGDRVEHPERGEHDEREGERVVVASRRARRRAAARSSRRRQRRASPSASRGARRPRRRGRSP